MQNRPRACPQTAASLPSRAAAAAGTLAGEHGGAGGSTRQETALHCPAADASPRPVRAETRRLSTSPLERFDIVTGTFTRQRSKMQLRFQGLWLSTCACTV